MPPQPAHGEAATFARMPRSVPPSWCVCWSSVTSSLLRDSQRPDLPLTIPSPATPPRRGGRRIAACRNSQCARQRARRPWKPGLWNCAAGETFSTGADERI